MVSVYGEGGYYVRGDSCRLIDGARLHVGSPKEKPRLARLVLEDDDFNVQGDARVCPGLAMGDLREVRN